MKKTDESNRAIFKSKTDAIFAQPDAVILAGSFEAFEIRNLPESFAASTCSMTFLIRRNNPASVIADKSESKESRKAAFTQRG